MTVGAGIYMGLLLSYPDDLNLWLSPLIGGMVAGAAAMVTVGAITMAEARRAIDARSIILVGGMLAMAEAMKSSNAAGYLAQSIVDATGEAGDAVVLAAILLVAILVFWARRRRSTTAVCMCRSRRGKSSLAPTSSTSAARSRAASWPST